MTIHAVVAQVTDRIRARGQKSRERYLEKIAAAKREGPVRGVLDCGNLAHVFAACGAVDKDRLKTGNAANIGIVTAYNDMLSAHQPFERYPEIIRNVVRALGGTAQVAGGVPAMCDGVTQGRPGMELSLFSREVIAQAAAIALSHNAFDGALMLGVCDKIVPGLVTAALSFGHLPTILVPAGPMPTGLPNFEKTRIRQLYAEGKVDRAGLLEGEAKSYHAPGTCTFYGTANSNQMLMEVMGLHLPGASFEPANTALRDALTRAAAKRITEITALGTDYLPIGRLFDERVVVNGVVGLLATGGSTNETLHLVAMARAAGIRLSWDDFDALSHVVPLMARVYPNGPADVNQFHQAGGLAYLIAQLLDLGLLHADVETVAGPGLERYRNVPALDGDTATWSPGPTNSADEAVLRPAANPFSPDGGLRMLSGNLGRCVMKVSAVAKEYWTIEAPVRVFEDQNDFIEAFKRGELDRDVIAALLFQGPKANGMPELHKLVTPLGVLLGRGFKVALLTDGRLSGASGKVPAAIHLTPEAAAGGPLAKLRDGDVVRLDAVTGTVNVLVDAAEFDAREPAAPDLSGNEDGLGRELFHVFRAAVGPADEGAGVFFRG